MTPVMRGMDNKVPEVSARWLLRSASSSVVSFQANCVKLRNKQRKEREEMDKE
jgi:hypothetical protein